MNVAHVSVSTVPVLHRFGGAIQRVILELSMAQARAGHEVTVLSPGDTFTQVDVDGVKVVFLPCVSPFPMRHIEFQWRAARYVARARCPDIIHFHSQPEGTVTSWPLGASKVLSYDFFRFRRATRFPAFNVYRRLLLSFDLLLPCSQYCRDESSRFWRIPPAELPVLYDGVNTDQFRPDSEAGRRERENLKVDTFVLLYVGRVNKQKGSDLLLEAYARLRARRSDVNLVIAGPIGQFEGQSQSASWTEKMRHQGVTYLGPVDESRLTAVYNLADVFVMPTREDEMLGMAALEAQACGVPVIASDLGGLREVVPYSCGGRFPVGDVDALTIHIERMVDDMAYRRECSRRARKHAVSFDWGTIEQRAAELYGRCGTRSTLRQVEVGE